MTEQRRSVSSEAAIPSSFLKVPPFPGSRVDAFARPSQASAPTLSDGDAGRLVNALRSGKVGATYWAAQPTLPAGPYTLLRVRNSQARAELLRQLSSDSKILCWTDRSTHLPPGIDIVTGPCDPWHLVSRASRVVADSDDDLAVVAAVAGVPVTVVRRGAFDELAGEAAITEAVRHRLQSFDYFSPYTGEPIDAATAISLCAFWRRTIDSNRSLAGALGFAFWKRRTVAALLWAGSGDVHFLGGLSSAREGQRIALWKSKAPRDAVAKAQRKGVRLVEAEDGFIRSSGLGADCIAPLSIVVDPVGIHFDPSRPSLLEEILEKGDLPEDLIDRARQLREVIVSSGLTKYGRGASVSRPPLSDRSSILVPGQVEDDRAVLAGGCGLASNLQLLRQVRDRAPDAHIFYKPHPDVEAGHRRGTIPDNVCLKFADEIARGETISSLLDRVDEVHVNTSLAGFEALLREKPVTTHGVPFYAGWGLTTDLGPVPDRRTERRSLDELVAAALLLYPRYLDPLTGLPCPPEILVERLCSGFRSSPGVIVRLRQIQGRFMRSLTTLRRLVAVQ